ncbi:hypothetical protein HYALB_00013383 [Hymenoscyphus albidus]|uniref:Uncharacterized protein n=1 Tax=Hymenoscyphus albidus TaxID=595503 RepID=A0A9N9M1N8_9HELO|nr:hypothetical protein HYALB_00013383 [Hymenoscyphus albidus]
MKSQEAAFRDMRKPAKKPKVAVVNTPATPKGIAKNKSRNERRKAARRTAALMREQGLPVAKKGAKTEAVAKEGDDADMEVEEVKEKEPE